MAHHLMGGYRYYYSRCLLLLVYYPLMCYVSAGTRGAIDFVELPSHLMEYWSRCYEAVREWAIDAKTGEEHGRACIYGMLCCDMTPNPSLRMGTNV